MSRFPKLVPTDIQNDCFTPFAHSKKPDLDQNVYPVDLGRLGHTLLGQLSSTLISDSV